jgi:hypothetical protein
VSHVRAQLRAAVVAALASVAASVMQTRTYSVSDDDLPAVLVFTNAEDVTGQTINANPTIEREVRLTIQILGHASTNLDEQLDDLAVAVEKALAAGVLVGGATVSLAYQGAEWEWDSPDVPRGAMTMTWIGKIYSAAGSPDVLGM